MPKWYDQMSDHDLLLLVAGEIPPPEVDENNELVDPDEETATSR